MVWSYDFCTIVAVGVTFNVSNNTLNEQPLITKAKTQQNISKYLLLYDDSEKAGAISIPMYQFP